MESSGSGSPYPRILFTTCPFCSAEVNWNVLLTKLYGGLARPVPVPVSYSSIYQDCPTCGNVAFVCEVSEDRNEVIIRLVRESSTSDEVCALLESSRCST